MSRIRLEFIFYLLCVLIIVFFLTSCEKPPSRQNYFPETGGNALYQRSLDLQNNFNVLSIALKPGYEDLGALAYFRLGRGAKIMSAFVTNGEAGESDVRGEYPHYLAGKLREEAWRAVSYLGGDAYFLNMPDIAAARDSAKVREFWPSDSLQTRLTALITQFKPDIILIAANRSAAQKSLMIEALQADVLAVVKNMISGTDLFSTNGATPWKVSRVFAEDAQKGEFEIDIDQKHPRWGKRYRTIAEEAGSVYQTMAVQRKAWRNHTSHAYSFLYPKLSYRIDAIDDGLPKSSSNRLRGIERRIRNLTAKTIKGKTDGVLKSSVAILDSVNYLIARRSLSSAEEQRTLLDWKKGLDDLRCTLLGVKVKYTVSDTALTELQLTYVTIENVEGLPEGGETFVYFGGLEEGWVVNEGFEKKFPYQPGERYRLLTPKNLTFTSPQALYGLESARANKPIMFFIIHRSPHREQSFVHRSVVNLTFSPRFLAECLTPIVRVIPGEYVQVRLKNFSRDGVTDTLRVEHDFVSSTESIFRLSNKEDTHLAHLYLIWNQMPEDGSYLIPVHIDGFEVTRFAAKKFSAEVDLQKRVGLITGLKHSPLADALRRLRADFSLIESEQNLKQRIDSLDVIIIDRRAMTLDPQMAKPNDAFERFVETGGHLIILAQNARAWNESPFVAEVELTPTQRLDYDLPLRLDESHAFFNFPNRITEADWSGWLYLRAHNSLAIADSEALETPVSLKDGGEPLLLTQKKGRGKITYIDLALTPQLLNVHAGAFRLLANLISN